MKDFFDELYRAESRGVLATLVRLLRDIDLAEEALSEAFAAAVERWPAQGVPENPRAWLVSAGRFKAIDSLRRRARVNANLEVLANVLVAPAADPAGRTDEVRDDQLRLVFTCCHPDLPLEGQVALTLREVCGLTTDEIARAFLTTSPTIGQRIVRAKAKIRDGCIPYELPAPSELGERLDAVLTIVYLVFNEGYRASSGPSLTRGDLSGEAIRLGRLLARLLPEPEVLGLLALMILNESRRRARTGPDGELVLIADQDRALWAGALIAEGCSLVERSLRSLRFGRYTLEAAIAAVHSESPSLAATDWAQIVGLYDVLYRLSPSPVVALNRAVALSMRSGPEVALPEVRALATTELEAYQPAHAALADLSGRAGRLDDARAAYRRALELTCSEPERRFLERRLRELGRA